MRTLFNGRYKIINLIGSGGMSKVYLAENISLGTYWAIKVVEKKSQDTFDLLAEPNILKKLNHPALPRIIDIEEDEECIYIIEDYIDGTSLDKKLNKEGSFYEEIVIEWAKQLCDVFLYLHNQKPNPIIYRDMKPSNIMVTEDNKVKLIDFGIAREFKSNSESDTTYLGTRGYAAPEQYGTSQSDERTDIYSLGATLYHLLTGITPLEPPYEFKKLKLIDDKFSEGIEFIVNKCVQNDPMNRYQNVQELLYDLENIHTFNSLYKRGKNIEKIKTGVKAAMIIASSAFILLGTNVIADEKSEKYDNLIELGYKELNLYNFDDSLAYFEEAKAVSKKKVESYLGIAQLMLKQNKNEESISYLEELPTKLKTITEDPQYFYLKGSAYYESGDYKKAIFNYEKAVQKDSSKVEYSRDLAVSLAKSGNLYEAENIIKNVMDKGASNDIVYYLNGEILSQKGELVSAIDNFNKVIDITKDEIIKKKSYIEISNIYKENRNSMENALSNQIEILEEATRNLADKDDVIITESLGEAYFSANIYEKSIEKFKKLLDVGYDRPYIYRNLAIIYQQIGSLSEAKNILLKMEEKYPNDYKCYLQLAFLYLEIEGNSSDDSRDYSKVLEYYNLAVKFAPDGENTSDIIPLRSKINELRQKGWI